MIWRSWKRRATSSGPISRRGGAPRAPATRPLWESLGGPPPLQHLFHQVEKELEEWARLAAVFLSRFTGNIAVVTQPRAPEGRLKRVELVALQEFLALMLLVLWEVRVKQQLLAFDRPVSQGELGGIAGRFTQASSA